MTEIVVKQSGGVIDFNFDEIKDYLNGQLEIYKGLQFTEETKSDAKKSVAELRKLRTSVEDTRKAVKKDFMKPYEEFEGKMKELVALIDEPINLINKQVDEFEQKRLQEKKEEIKKIYSENMPEEIQGILTLARIYNTKWENASTSKKDIADAIKTEALNFQNNANIIKSMKEECEEEALEVLGKTLNLAEAISYINDYKAKKEAVLVRQKAMEEQKAKEEAERKAKEEEEKEPVVESIEEDTEVPEVTFADVESEITSVAMYEINADEFDLARMESALTSMDIKFRRVR